MNRRAMSVVFPNTFRRCSLRARTVQFRRFVPDYLEVSKGLPERRIDPQRFADAVRNELELRYI